MTTQVSNRLHHTLHYLFRHESLSLSATNAWVLAMTEQLLVREDCHVITVSWGSVARRFRFEQATANARLVGAEISYLLDNIKVGVLHLDPRLKLITELRSQRMLRAQKLQIFYSANIRSISLFTEREIVVRSRVCPRHWSWHWSSHRVLRRSSFQNHR